MIDYPENDPTYWRGKARHARIVAEYLRRTEAREHILAVAASYEALADLAGQQSLFGEGTSPHSGAVTYIRVPFAC
jgi:hypothetical protein